MATSVANIRLALDLPSLEVMQMLEIHKESGIQDCDEFVRGHFRGLPDYDPRTSEITNLFDLGVRIAGNTAPITLAYLDVESSASNTCCK